MPLNPNIILGVQPAQFRVPDPLDSAQKSMALQALMGQQDMQAMQMRQAQRAEADDEATRNAVRGGGDRSAIIERLMAAGQFRPADALRKSGLEEDKTRAEINAKRVSAMGDLLKFDKEAAAAVMANPTQETALAWLDQGERRANAFGFPEMLPGIQAQRQRVMAAQDPNSIRSLAAGWALNADKMLPQYQVVQSNGQSVPVDMNSLTNPSIGSLRLPTADPAKDLILPDGSGGYRPNAPLVAAKAGIARAGAANTSVSVNTSEKPFLTQLGEGVGKSIISDFDQARAAVNTLNNASQIERSLGNVIAGPGANVRVTLAQIGQTLGINGANSTEQLVNTRNAIQGLARQELAAAGQMKGQGQITEAERGILRRAEAGDISEMTVPELKTFLTAIRKTANYKIRLHNDNLGRLKQNPNAAPVMDFLQVQTPDQPPASVDPGAVDAALKKYLPGAK